MVGVIDLGSNSFISVVVDGKKDVFEKMVVTGLGSKMRDGFIEDCSEARGVFLDLLKETKGYTNDVHAFGTAVFRNATNGGDCFKEITGDVKGRILSPWEEGRYSYLSVVWDEEMGVMNPVVVDLGGGSLEIVTKESISTHPFGTWRVREIVEDPFETAEEISKELEIPPGEVVGIGGTFVTIGAYKVGKWDLEKVHGIVLDIEDVESLIERIKDMSDEEIEKLEFVPKGRGKTLLPGAVVVLAVLKKVGKLKVSKRGYRYGIAWELEMTSKK